MTTGSTITAPDLAALIKAQADLQAVEGLPLDRLVGINQLPLLAVPKGKEIHNLTDDFERWFGPIAVRQLVTLSDVASVIAYLQRFKAEGATSVFIDPGRKADEERKITAIPPSLRAVVDYHTGPGEAGRAQHVVTYKFPVSDELTAWMKIDGELLNQAQVVEHLLDRENDIANPPISWQCVSPEIVEEIQNALNLADDLAPRDENGNFVVPEGLDPDPDGRTEDGDERYIPRTALAKLAEIKFAGLFTMKRLAASLEMTSSARATSSIDFKTGAQTVDFVDDRDTKVNGKKVTLPDFFLLNIPLFQNDKPTLLPVRPVVRMRSSGVVWGFLLAHVDRVLARRIGRVAEEIAQGAGVPVYIGTAS